MTNKGRYKTSHLVEDQYEPGSRKRVLRNLLGIKSKREIDRLETEEQVRARRISSSQYHKRKFHVCNGSTYS